MSSQWYFNRFRWDHFIFVNEPSSKYVFICKNELPKLYDTVAKIDIVLYATDLDPLVAW